MLGFTPTTRGSTRVSPSLYRSFGSSAPPDTPPPLQHCRTQQVHPPSPSPKCPHPCTAPPSAHPAPPHRTPPPNHPVRRISPTSPAVQPLPSVRRAKAWQPRLVKSSTGRRPPPSGGC